MLLLIVVLMALGFGAWTLLSQPEAPREASSAERTAPAGPTEDPLTSPDLLDAATEGPRPIGRVDAGPVGDYAHMERVFDGTGTIRVDVSTDPGVPFPETWTLTLAPSEFAEGRDRAVTRVIESEPGQRDHTFRDLPLAAYAISVEADGLESRPLEVAIYRLAGTSSGLTSIGVDIRLRPMLWVDGAVRTAGGDVADGLPVFLVNREDRSWPRRESATDNAGLFRFDHVRSGSWLLQVGDPVRPLVGSIPVVIDTQPARLDEVVLPPLATLELLVVDEYGRPFPDVDLVGYLRGAGNGSFRVKSDAVGRASIRYLTPGPWRVDAKYEPEGQTGKADCALTVNDSETVHEVHIR